MSSDRVLSVRSAWINRVRDEALRMRRPEVAKCFHIGIIIATYADADGSNAFPSAETIAAVAGCTEETVTRCVKVLVAVGLMARRRRPNRSAVYQLLIPVERPDWGTHLHLYTDTRQARAKKAKKAREVAEALAARTASQDGFRKPFPPGVPEPVPAGVTEGSGTRSGTGSVPVAGRVPETVPAGGDMYSPTSGRDPDPDHDVAGLSPQPQDACASASSQSDAHDRPPPPGPPALRTVPLPPGGRRTVQSAVGGQRALLLPVRTPAHVDADLAELRANATADDVCRALAELGQTEAVRAYGWRLVSPHIATSEPDTGS